MTREPSVRDYLGLPLGKPSDRNRGHAVSEYTLAGWYRPGVVATPTLYVAGAGPAPREIHSSGAARQDNPKGEKHEISKGS